MTRDDPSGAAHGPGDRGDGEAFRVLFVCTGNTCRSPLAEALTRRALARLGWDQVEVRSAGVAAQLGGMASEGSIRAAARHGLDLSEHRSTPLNEDLIGWADLILTMSPGHLTAVTVLGGGAKASLIKDFAAGLESGAHPVQGGVVDPMGGGDVEYEATFQELEILVDRVLERLGPLVAP